MDSIKTTRAWTLNGTNGFESLKFNEQFPLGELTDHDVLIKLHAASLNYRDVAILKGQYPLNVKPGVVPGSDGAGEVIAVGSKVTRFQKGDNVMTLFNQGHLAGSLTSKTINTGVGGMIDGVLREHAVYNENGLVAMPAGLNWLEASTLPCAAVTAWNALYGVKPLQPGQVVLTQGTGGVSIFAVQFAKAGGATIIATTSSASKSKLLKDLGADHVINYKEEKEWGAKAKALTSNGEGVDNVIEVGGPLTIAQSLEATRFDGVISIIGFLSGGAEQGPSFMEVLSRNVLVRGVLVGSRLQFEDMNRAIEANKIKPLVDKKIFKLKELKEAYQYLWEQKHFGKLCVEID